MDNNGYNNNNNNNNNYYPNWTHYNHIPERIHPEHGRVFNHQSFGERQSCGNIGANINQPNNYINHQNLWNYNNLNQNTGPYQQSYYGVHQPSMMPEMVTRSEGYTSPPNISSPSFPPIPHSTNEEVDSSQKRTTFSKVQLQKLEERFLSQSFLNKEERIEFAEELYLTERQVMIWFQNRRSRLKKRGPSDRAYHIKQQQDQKILGMLRNSERVFPFFERVQQRVGDEDTFGDFMKNS